MAKARIFNIMQYEKHPTSGEPLWSVSQIEEGLDHKTIVEWAWVYHDKDKWTEQDELADSSHIAGQTKPPHYHVAISVPKNAMEVETIARWFGVPMNFVDIVRGRGAFLDCVEYLTHEGLKQQKQGKYRYDDSEIHANFDWRKELDERALSRAKYGKEVDLKTALRLKVFSGELTLRDVRRLYEINYITDMERLTKLRLAYLSAKEPPRIRHNYYISGGGGQGKGTASRVLAHALYPDIEDEADLIFRVGAEGTTFEGYDGQPVIIWDDCRSIDLLKKLGGRGNVFNVFDPIPHKQYQNVKYGAINLVNSVNIVNSVQPWEEFLNGLVGEYTDRNGELHKAEDDEKSQSYRRFPFIMPLREEDFDILISRAYIEGTRDFDEYIKFKNLKGNFAKIAMACPDVVSLVNVTSPALEPLVTARDKVDCRKTTIELSPEEIAEFGKGGEQVVYLSQQSAEYQSIADVDEQKKIDELYEKYLKSGGGQPDYDEYEYEDEPLEDCGEPPLITPEEIAEAEAAAAEAWMFADDDEELPF